MQVTEMMQTEIKNKEKLNKKLTSLSNELVALEISEARKRVALMNKIEAEAEKKVTDKTKTALCDAELKNEMNKIKHLKNNINTVKREIDLCNDKISLARNMIREMEITQL